MKYLVTLLFGLISGAVIAFFYFSDEVDPTEKNGVLVPDKKIKRELVYLTHALDSLHSPMPNPVFGEWLYHNREVHQSVYNYLKGKPKGVTRKRSIVYLQPLGEFTKEQREVLEITSEYLGIFYNVDTKINEELSIDLVPKTQRRNHQGFEQINCTWVMREVLEPKLPEDAVAYLAFTNYDLFPSSDYNFVFGQGSLGKRTGIYSTARFGDPSIDSTSYSDFLSRTLKVAGHELGHMFSITHCTEYRCIMNGSNSLQESDGKPHFLCPEDLLKVSKHMDVDISTRFFELSKFWHKHGYFGNEQFCFDSISLLSRNRERE